MAGSSAIPGASRNAAHAALCGLMYAAIFLLASLHAGASGNGEAAPRVPDNDLTAASEISGQSAPKQRNRVPVRSGPVVDYPEQGAVFPPGFAPPTFIWRDAAASSEWEIEVRFGDGAPAVHLSLHAGHMQLGAIDPRCVAPTNELPTLTAKEAASWIWKPDADMWKTIQAHSVKAPAVFQVRENRNGRKGNAARAAFATSTDPVDAPIFYRDVPLMPAANAEGVIQPLPANAMHLINWRLRDLREAESHTVLSDVPTCLNCHSFAANGRTMGIDLDGPRNDKGLYAIAPVEKHITIEDKNVVQWNTDGQAGKARVGFMSQVSPSGRYVLSGFTGSSLAFNEAYYVRNYASYKFLQVFYPTKGILEWYDRQSGRRQPLPGADLPDYVQTNGVWSPDEKWVVFARARAREPYDRNKPLAQSANDPNETQIQYDLYRVPFHDGKGGPAERIVGAGRNGMSNSFPKVSPDGKWVVFVEARNGELMRPDSQLYIVPLEGGKARPLRSNMYPMNSWHSWSPNSRWLVFSSKAQGPYTRMYLTHIDAHGNSSPAIRIDNATAANRAVNLPEFVNTSGDGIEEIQLPVIQVYRLLEKAMDLEDKKGYEEALPVLRQAEEAMPEDARIHNDMATVLFYMERNDEAIAEVREAMRLSPSMVQAHFNLGAFLVHAGRLEEAVPELERAREMNASFAQTEEVLAYAYLLEEKSGAALQHYRKALELNPKSLAAMIGAARILASARDAALRNGKEAVRIASLANDLTHNQDAMVLDVLGASYAEAGDFRRALELAQNALELADAQGNSELREMILVRMDLYRKGQAYRK
jgi:tetratricopeptide (TPR) repeat protein